VADALMAAADAGVAPEEGRGAVLRGADFVARRLVRIPTPDGELFSYTPGDRRGVHNASILAAALLARASAIPGGDPAWAPVGGAVAATTLRAQRADGSWPYGITARDAFVDSFHTGYILSAMAAADRAVGIPGAKDGVARGLAFWSSAFLVSPAVGHRPGRPYPVETHAVAQGILTLLEFPSGVPGARAHARRLARWALDHARRRDGAFVYLWHPRRRNDIVYLRWVQAWMFRALATLAAAG